MSKELIEGPDAMEAMKLDIGLTIWTLLTFGGLFLLLARFAFKPLRRLLEERERTIRESLEAAAKTHAEARELLARNVRQTEEARGEVRKMIDEGQKIVARMKHEAGDAARVEAEAIVSQARAEIDREMQRSLEDLKGTVASLAARISRQVIKEELNEDRHSKLADDFIERLKKTHAIRKP